MSARAGRSSDLVVTVPCERWADWLAEGGCAGTATLMEFGYYIPKMPACFGDGLPGVFGRVHQHHAAADDSRVYVVAGGKLRGYAPLVRIDPSDEWSAVFPDRPRGYVLVRKGGAVAVTIPQAVHGFRGFRYRWWPREDERPFPDWKVL